MARMERWASSWRCRPQPRSVDVGFCRMRVSARKYASSTSTSQREHKSRALNSASMRRKACASSAWLHERPVLGSFGEDELGRRHGQEGVGARPWRDVPVGEATDLLGTGSMSTTRPPRRRISRMMGTRLTLVETGLRPHRIMDRLFRWSRGSWETRLPKSRFWAPWPVPPHSDPQSWSPRRTD
jgi:hypothetical protein